MVLAATNRPWDLDEAIRRRLEKRVYIPLPSKGGRKHLFAINLTSIALDPAIDFDELVRKTDGYSGADITNVCREAALMPMRRKLLNSDFNIEKLKDHQAEIEMPLTMDDFEEAIQNIQKSVSPEQLSEFQNWMDEYGAK